MYGSVGKFGAMVKPEQSTIPEVVDVRLEVGDERRRRVGDAVVRDDAAALLGHEDATVGGEADRDRVRVGRCTRPDP